MASQLVTSGGLRAVDDTGELCGFLSQHEAGSARSFRAGRAQLVLVARRTKQ